MSNHIFKNLATRSWLTLRTQITSRGFALFLLPWLIVLLVPSLRSMLRVQVLGSPFDLNLRYPWTKEYSRQDVLRLAAKYANDARVLSRAAEQEEDYQKKLQKYDALIARFPKDNWLIANCLLQAPIPEQRAGESAVIYPYPLSGALMKVMPYPEENEGYEDYEEPIVLSPPPVTTIAPPYGNAGSEKRTTRKAISSELKKAIALARLGQKREPDNAFFDWLLFGYLRTAHHDDEAIRVLRAAARKRRYNDHLWDDTGAEVFVRQLARPLLLEEKVALAKNRMGARSDMQTYHIRTARLAMWVGVLDDRMGRTQRALQIYGDVAQLGRLIRNSHPWNWRSGAVVQKIGWRGVLGQLTYIQTDPSLMNLGATKIRTIARKFAAYATKHGRPDLAQQAMRDSKVILNPPLGSDAGFEDIVFFTPPHTIPRDTMDSIEVLWGCGVAFIFLMPLLIAFRVFLFFPLWTPKLRADVSGRDIAYSATLYAVLAALTVIFVWGKGRYWSTWADIGYAAIALVGVYFPSALLLNAILCAGITVERERKTIFARRPPKYEGLSAKYLPPNLMPLVVAICSWSVVLLAAACWLGALLAYYSPSHNLTLPLPPFFDLLPSSETIYEGDFLAMATLFTGFCYAGWLLRWRWSAPQHLRPISHYALRWHLQSLGAWLIVLSFAYLVVSLVSLPARRTAETRLERFLKVP